MSSWQVHKDKGRCIDCGTCQQLVACPNEKECIGCGACVLACPHEALNLVPAPDRGKITLEIDGHLYTVPGGVTVLEALRLIGYQMNSPPQGEGITVPCRTGGCFSCAVEVQGRPLPACITGVRQGMKVKTQFQAAPLRIVGGFTGHSVGGVGTPYQLKGYRYIEVACFAAGCNFRCPQCQNWTTTYLSKAKTLRPREAAEAITRARKSYAVDRMAISGGESTLNRKWLLEYVREVRALNPDTHVRIHIDTNGSLLTEDYLAELVEAGMTDIGIDLKAWDLETFCRITGLKDEELTQTYRDTAWRAVEYLRQHHPQVFVGVGIPFNRELISLDGISIMGEKLYALDPALQVCVLDYRPQFRRMDLHHPSYDEMLEVYGVLKDVGMEVVTCQTPRGYIGP